MTRFDRCAALLLLFVAPVPLVTQSRQPVPIEPLLRSDEARLIALGAWEVIRRQDDSLNPLLIELAERWDPEHHPELQSQDWSDAVTVVLDALIQRKVQVSPAAVVAIANAFPDQALILVARMDSAEAESILLSLYQENRAGARGSREQRLLGRVTAMFLARDHPGDIAASLLADSIAQLEVSVPDAREPGAERCFSGCKAFPPCRQEIMDEARTGWPHIFRYALEENEPAIELRNGLLIYAGGDTITWRRSEAAPHRDDCFTPEPLTSQTRHRLLAQMLQVREADLRWGAQMTLRLGWFSDQQYLRDLGTQIREQEDRLLATVRSFYAKGLLTKSQFDAIRPRLIVVVFDDRNGQMESKQALPLPQIRDSRTVCRLAPQS